jgi:hypothetical protein
MSAPAPRFRRLLDELGISAGDLVFLHTSFHWLRHLELSPREILDTLAEHLSPSGTMVLPSFGWHLDGTQRPWKGYADYYRTRPVFDVRSTPANIGVIPETFRTMPGVRRSLHYWWSVAARGPLADFLVSDQHEVLHPYGADSTFGRLYRAGAKVLGLGVSLNTSSLAPVVDQELGGRHTQAVFSETPEEGVVIDRDGRRMVTRGYWLLPDVVRLIEPSRVIERTDGLEGRMLQASHEDAIHFAYVFRDYLECALRLAAPVVADGRRVPWLERYSVMRGRIPTP